MTAEMRTKARAVRRARLAVTFDGLRGEPPPSIPSRLRVEFIAARERVLGHARELAREITRRARSAKKGRSEALGERVTAGVVSKATKERIARRLVQDWLESRREVQRSRTYTRASPLPPRVARDIQKMLDAYDSAVSAELAGADQVRSEISAAGGRAKARIVRVETAERDRQIRARARQLEREGRSRRELPGLLAPHFNLSARRIRDILKTA